MTEYVYTKSITNDFSGSFNSTNLKNELETNLSIQNCLRINTLGDAVYIIFSSELSTDEEHTLNTTIIPGHSVNIETVYTNNISLPLKTNDINTETYKRISVYTYIGSVNFKSIVSIKAIGHMDSGVTDYTIRVDDNTNNKMISEATFTNESEMLLDLGSLSNIPEDQAILEISVKCTQDKKNKKAYLENITMYFGD